MTSLKKCFLWVSAFVGLILIVVGSVKILQPYQITSPPANIDLLNMVKGKGVTLPQTGQYWFFGGNEQQVMVQLLEMKPALEGYYLYVQVDSQVKIVVPPPMTLEGGTLAANQPEDVFAKLTGVIRLAAEPVNGKWMCNHAEAIEVTPSSSDGNKK